MMESNKSNDRHMFIRDNKLDENDGKDWFVLSREAPWEETWDEEHAAPYMYRWADHTYSYRST